MLLSLKDFDPIVFLDINTDNLSSEEIAQLRNQLNGKIGEYLLLKFSADLTKEQLKEVSSITEGKELLEKLNTLIPGLETKILQEIENFKKEYLEIINKDNKGL